MLFIVKVSSASSYESFYVTTHEDKCEVWTIGTDVKRGISDTVDDFTTTTTTMRSEFSEKSLQPRISVVPNPTEEDDEILKIKSRI